MSKNLPPISPYLLDQVEQALGLKLYLWQRAYIQDKYYNRHDAEGRQTGKTLAYILKRLLTPGLEITKEKLPHYSDEICNINYNVWFARWAIEINEKLKAAGIETNLID